MTIVPLQSLDEARICARYMAASEPWVTLGRDYQMSLDTILHPDKTVFLAVRDDDIAGFIILNLHGALVGYIQSICVRPDVRGSGIGSQLLDYAEAYLFQRYANIFIMVSSFNEKARRLYERRGYEIVGELSDHIVSGHSEWILRRRRSSV